MYFAVKIQASKWATKLENYRDQNWLNPERTKFVEIRPLEAPIFLRYEARLRVWVFDTIKLGTILVFKYRPPTSGGTDTRKRAHTK